jgi:hypothetical protein
MPQSGRRPQHQKRLERQREPTVHVRFAPKADKQADVSLSPLCARKRHMHRSKRHHYSITSSARTRSVTPTPASAMASRLVFTPANGAVGTRFPLLTSIQQASLHAFCADAVWPRPNVGTSKQGEKTPRMMRRDMTPLKSRDSPCPSRGSYSRSIVQSDREERPHVAIPVSGHPSHRAEAIVDFL